MRPPAARDTSSCDGRSNGSANAIVSRPHVLTTGTAFTLIQKSTGLDLIRSEETMKFSGSDSGGMLRYAAAASVNAAGSTRFFWTR